MQAEAGDREGKKMGVRGDKLKLSGEMKEQ